MIFLLCAIGLLLLVIAAEIWVILRQRRSARTLRESEYEWDGIERRRVEAQKRKIG